MRITPLPKSRRSSPKLGIVAGSSTTVESNNCREEVDTVAETRWLYELKLAQTLPVINMSRTPASILLSAAAYQWYECTIHRFTPLLLTLFRVSLVAFAGLLVVPTAIVRPWIPLIFVLSTLPPVIFASFYSVEVLALMPKFYDFWFISMLNSLTWFGLGVIFGDLRAITCLTLWFSFQTVVTIDANFRTFPAAVKSSVMSGPAMMALVVCCAYSLVVDSTFPTLYIGVISFQSRQVVVFTASTIAIFMLQKAYTKRRRMRIRERDRKNNPDPTPGRYTIPCLLIFARVRLELQSAFCTEPDTPNNTRIRPATEARADLSLVQQLQLAPAKALVIDARNTLLPNHFVNRLCSRSTLAVFYSTGVMGIAMTSVSWISLLLHYQSESTAELRKGVAVLAALFSFIFVAVCVALTQRDLLRLLVWNFNVLFSTFQSSFLAICLLDLLQWQTSSTLAVIAWWFWFHFLLLLDALTPTFKKQLDIRKHFGLPAAIVVLCVAAGCAMRLLIADGDVFKSRLLWSVRVVDDTGFDIFTSILASQRTVTIFSWFARLLVDLAPGRPDQLLFIRRQVEYFSPYVTFMEPTLSASNEVTVSDIRRR